MDKKKTVIYTVVTLISAWIIQSVISVYFMQNQTAAGKSVFQVGLSAMMFVPAIVAIIVNKGFKGFGWKPKFKGCGWLIPVCMFVPGIMAIAGAALFFVFFPRFLDFSGSYLIAQGEQMGMDYQAMLAQKGMTMQTYNIISILSAILYAPIINMFVALGEEVGWRGFLYPELPFVGWIVFTVSCIVMGAFEEMVYNKTKCIWYPALLHGAVNATSFVLMFLNAKEPDLNKYMILGPAFNGLISMIPMVVLAVILGIAVTRKK